MDEKTKTQLASCGSFTGILLLLFIILSGLVFLSLSSWENGLRKNTDYVLQGYSENLHCGEMLPIKEGIVTSAAFYQLMDKDTVKGYAAIVRMTTYYGPVPAVFIQEQNSSEVIFAGVYGLRSSINMEFSNDSNDLVINYWKDKCSRIFDEYKKSLEDGE